MEDLNDFVRFHVPAAFSDDDDDDDDQNLAGLLNNSNASFSDTNLCYVFPDDEAMTDLWNNFNPSLSDINQTSLSPIPFSPIELSQEFNHPISNVNDDNMVFLEPIAEDQDVGINNVAINGGEECNHQISNGDNFNMVFLQPIVGDQDMGINNGGEDFQADLSHIKVGNPPLAHHNNMESTNYNAGVSFPRMPPMAKPFYCTYCEVLRDIIHTNGVEYTTMEIHGRLGLICHGILRQNIAAGSLETHQEYQMIEFGKKSIDEIKATLMDYCLVRNEAGYTLVDDKLSSYYEALSIGLDWTDDVNTNPTDPEVPEEEPEIQRADVETRNQRADEPRNQRVNVGPRNQRPSMAEQRAKASRMRLTDLSDYFHLNLDVTSALVGLSTGAIGKIYKKEGLARWPYRKVQSFAKQISALKKQREAGDEATRARAQADINNLLNKMVEHCAGVAPTGLNLY